MLKVLKSGYLEMLRILKKSGKMSRDQIFFLILSTVDDEFFSFC